MMHNFFSYFRSNNDVSTQSSSPEEITPELVLKVLTNQWQSADTIFLNLIFKYPHLTKTNLKVFSVQASLLELLKKQLIRRSLKNCGGLEMNVYKLSIIGELSTNDTQIDV